MRRTVVEDMVGDVAGDTLGEVVDHTRARRSSGTVAKELRLVRV